MLIIRRAQMAVFEEMQRGAFVEATVAALRRDLPDEFARLGEANVRQLVRSAIEKGQLYGLMRQGEVAGLALLMVSLGAGFDEEPDNGWMREILTSKSIEPEWKIGMILDQEAAEFEAEAAALEPGSAGVGQRDTSEDA